MDALVCDRCGKSLLVEESVRYRMDLRQKLAEEVLAERRYDLCPPCSRAVLERPFEKGS